MLVRFIKAGPVNCGPGRIHGAPGQFADIEGADLEAALAEGMVELAQAPIERAVKPGAKVEKRKG